MSARDDRTIQMRTYAAGLPFVSLAGQYLKWAADEIDRLRSENETLRHLVTPAPIEESRYADALHAEIASLRRWQQEACDWLVIHANPKAPTAERVRDLLRRAGKEVQ